MFWKRKKNKSTEFKCSECGNVHSEWPALAFKSPSNYDFLSDKEKNELGKLESDFCEIPQLARASFARAQGTK